MTDKKELLGTAPVGKLLFQLAIPTVIAQLINMLYNIVDRIYIGHIPEVGDLALTGVGVCMPVIMIVSALAALISSGGAPRASIFMGKRDNESAEKTLGGCFGLQLVISAILTTVLLIWNRDFLLAFGASENTIEYAVDYMSVYAIGTLFVQLTLGMNAFITAQGFTKISMLSVIVGAVANIILDPIFIYGFGMGVSGAAWATIISQALSCAWVISFLCGKRSLLKLRPKNFIASPKIVLPCIALGTATFIMQASESVISVCFNSSLLGYGGDIAVGAMTILTSVMQFAMLPPQGIAQGAQCGNGGAGGTCLHGHPVYIHPIFLCVGKDLLHGLADIVRRIGIDSLVSQPVTDGDYRKAVGNIGQHNAQTEVGAVAGEPAAAVNQQHRGVQTGFHGHIHIVLLPVGQGIIGNVQLLFKVAVILHAALGIPVHHGVEVCLAGHTVGKNFCIYLFNGHICLSL